MWKWRIMTIHCSPASKSVFILWLAPRTGKMNALDFPLCSRKSECFGVIFWPYKKSFTDEACSVTMAGYWPHSSFFFYVFVDWDEVEVNKNAKKELGQHPAILTSRLVNYAYIYWSPKNIEIFMAITPVSFLHYSANKIVCVVLICGWKVLMSFSLDIRILSQLTKFCCHFTSCSYRG